MAQETGLPTRRYSVDQNGNNAAAGTVGVDFNDFTGVGVRTTS